jgi:hypothetical protein
VSERDVPITEEYLEAHCRLSSVASERVTWEAAVAHLRKMAGEFYVRGEENTALVLRTLSKEFDQRRADASERQSVMLKEMGR